MRWGTLIINRLKLFFFTLLSKLLLEESFYEDLPSQLSIDVFIKRCSENMQQIYRRTHLCQFLISIKLRGKFIEIAIRHGCSSVNLLHIFRTPFPTNTYGGLLLFKTLRSSMQTVFV